MLYKHLGKQSNDQYFNMYNMYHPTLSLKHREGHTDNLFFWGGNPCYRKYNASCVSGWQTLRWCGTYTIYMYMYIIYIHRNICWQYSITWCSYLQYNAFVNGKLCDDVGQQQVPVVLGGGVHTVLTEQAGPGERHQAPQLVTLFSGVK